MKQQLSDDRTLAEQAQAWICRPPAPDSAESEAFALWLKRSPQHVQCYLQMLAVEREFHDIDPARRIDVDALIARTRDNVVQLNPGVETHPVALVRRRARRRSARRWQAIPAAAAVLFVAAGLFGWMWWSAHGAHVYRTATGQQQKLKLADGTIIDLNTESRLRVDFSRTRRDVYLLAGEALFDIHHDAHRPFRVHVDGAVITDIGTRFNVYRRAQATTVAVLDGAVEISSEASERTAAGVTAAPLRIDAGEMAAIDARAQPLELGRADVAQVTAWRQRRLWFQGTELGEIAAQFNRYNAAPKILVEDEALRSRRFSGVFNADDPKTFVQFLYQDADIDFDHDVRGFVIRAR